jgi:ribosome-binding factor A
MSSIQFYLERKKEQFIREIGWTIAQKVRDPRIPSIVTVTDIKLAPDTRNATVFISTYGDESEKENVVAALNRAAPYIQKIVARRIAIRHFPRLKFKFDPSLEYSQRINEILEDIKDDLV